MTHLTWKPGDDSDRFWMPALNGAGLSMEEVQRRVAALNRRGDPAEPETTPNPAEGYE